MSTHSDFPELRRGIARFAFSILGGLLLAFQLLLSPVAFAASPHTGDSVDPPQALAQSEVAVVRLVIDYTPTSASTATTAVLCPSLGVLVKSWPVRSLTDLNSWVLTGSNVLTTPTPCGPANATGKPATSYTLARIDVYANTSYTGNTAGNAFLGTYTATPSHPLLCSATTCSYGVVLFAFHTNQPQPTLDVATTDTTQQFGIELTKGTSPTTLPPQPVPSIAVAQQFLDPIAVAPDSTSTQQEVGIPLLNNQAQVVAMRTRGTALFTAADYHVFIAAPQAPFMNAPPNPLQAAWANGIKSYYAKNYRDAVTAFEQVETLNPNLKAATRFKQQAAAHLNSSQGSSTGGNPVSSSESTSWFGIPRSTFLIIGIGAAFLLLIMLLIIVSVWARRRHELARFEAKRVKAQRNAKRGMQQPQHSDEIVTKESYVSSESASFLHRLSIFTLIQVQLERASKFLSRDKGAIPVQHAASVPEKASTVNPQSPANQQCPNCGYAVPTSATYCPNCRYQLTAIARGAPPTSNISPAPELPIIGKATVPSTTTSLPQHGSLKEAILDDLAIQETLKRLWDKAGRLTL